MGRTIAHRLLVYPSIALATEGCLLKKSLPCHIAIFISSHQVSLLSSLLKMRLDGMASFTGTRLGMP